MTMHTCAAHCVIFHPMKVLSVCIFDESGGDNSMCMFFGHWVKFRKDKIMERCVYKYIHNYLLANCIIIPHQSGFTRGD